MGAIPAEAPGPLVAPLTPRSHCEVKPSRGAVMSTADGDSPRAPIPAEAPGPLVARSPRYQIFHHGLAAAPLRNGLCGKVFASTCRESSASCFMSSFS
jgi:hypothetical protein